MGFDDLSNEENAVDLPLSFLFNSDRLNRLVEYKQIYQGLGLDEMIDALVNATWKAPRKKGIEGLIQLQTEQLLLTYLLAAGIQENNSFATRSVVMEKLQSLKTFIEAKKKTTTDHSYLGHLILAQERMKTPETAKPSIHAVIPPGAPIGCE